MSHVAVKVLNNEIDIYFVPICVTPEININVSRKYAKFECNFSCSCCFDASQTRQRDTYSDSRADTNLFSQARKQSYNKTQHIQYTVLFLRSEDITSVADPCACGVCSEFAPRSLLYSARLVEHKRLLLRAVTITNFKKKKQKKGQFIEDSGGKARKPLVKQLFSAW